MLNLQFRHWIVFVTDQVEKITTSENEMKNWHLDIL